MAEKPASYEARAFLIAADYWLRRAAKRSSRLRRRRKREEHGLFFGHSALYVYCTDKKAGRVDIFYGPGDLSQSKRRRQAHGHVVINEGAVTYIRRLGDPTTTPLFDKKRGDSWNV